MTNNPKEIVPFYASASRSEAVTRSRINEAGGGL